MLLKRVHFSFQIATQVAVLTSKIARLDCPQDWNALVPTLLQAVRCNDTLIQQRALLVLHHVTKTLASKRLAPDRKLFESVSVWFVISLLVLSCFVIVFVFLQFLRLTLTWMQFLWLLTCAIQKPISSAKTNMRNWCLVLSQHLRLFS